jgi:hypothetical protein
VWHHRFNLGPRPSPRLSLRQFGPELIGDGRLHPSKYVESGINLVNGPQTEAQVADDYLSNGSEMF